MTDPTRALSALLLILLVAGCPATADLSSIADLDEGEAWDESSSGTPVFDSLPPPTRPRCRPDLELFGSGDGPEPSSTGPRPPPTA